MISQTSHLNGQIPVQWNPFGKFDQVAERGGLLDNAWDVIDGHCHARIFVIHESQADFTAFFKGP